MLGVKVKTVKTQKEYTLEEFYDAIKDYNFSAGHPEITKHGAATIIAFPPIDRKNQVQILPVIGLKKKTTNKFSVQKNEKAGMGRAVGNRVLADLTGGLTDIRGMIGKNNRAAEKLVDITVDELNAMNL